MAERTPRKNRKKKKKKNKNKNKNPARPVDVDQDESEKILLKHIGTKTVVMVLFHKVPKTARQHKEDERVQKLIPDTNDTNDTWYKQILKTVHGYIREGLTYDHAEHAFMDKGLFSGVSENPKTVVCCSTYRTDVTGKHLGRAWVKERKITNPEYDIMYFSVPTEQAIAGVKFSLEQVGKEYDTKAIEATYIGGSGTEDKVSCMSFCVAGLDSMDILKGWKYTELTPDDLHEALQGNKFLIPGGMHKPVHVAEVAEMSFNRKAGIKVHKTRRSEIMESIGEDDGIESLSRVIVPGKSAKFKRRTREPTSHTRVYSDHRTPSPLRTLTREGQGHARSDPQKSTKSTVARLPRVH